MADIQTLKAEMERELDELRALKAELAAQKQGSGGGLSRDDLSAIVHAAASAAAEPTNALVRKLKPENAEAPKTGPFDHPQGGNKYPKPDLPCDVWFGCKDREDTRALLRQRLDELSYFEAVALVELYQSLKPGQRRSTRDGKWKVTLSEHGDRIDMLVPIKSLDDRQDLPPFLGIINELKTGERTPDQADILQKMALLEQRVAELSGVSA